jgi:hypothetical protein
MYKEEYKFITTSKSLVYHFGARGSHRLEENQNKSSERQQMSEQKNARKFFEKWKGFPIFDEYGQIIGVR